MNLRTAARGFVAFLLSVPALQGNPYWAVTYPSSNICALRGSTVEIRCNYKYPYANTVEKKLWFTNIHNEPVDLKDDTDYTGRVKYSCVEHRCSYYYSTCTGTCTLRIENLTQSDSAEYKFRITTNNGGAYSGDPGVKLSVTDLQVKVVIPPTRPNWVRLECHSMCHFTRYPTYTWYRDGTQQHHGWFTWFYINSEYRSSCAVQGSEHLPSPSVYAPETPSVGWTPPGVIEEGSSVNLTCTSEANPVAKYTWTKVTTGHPPGHSDQGQQLSFHPIQSSHSGQYLCKAENDLGTKSSSPFSIDVKYGPKHTFVIPSPPGEIMEGGSVTLSCSSDANPAADYTWFKDNQPLLWEPSRPYTLDSVSSKDRGTYRCQAENQYGYLGSNSVFIDVLYAPKTPSVSVRPPGEIKEGGSVTLSCSSDANPAADYTWFKDNQPLLWEPRRPYTLDSVRSKDRGTYHCQGENQYGYLGSNSVFIDVLYAPKTPSVSVRPPGGIKEGGSVTLSCSSDANPAADYTWFKDNQPLLWEPSQPYTLDPVSSKDRGTYHCQAENQYGYLGSNSVFIDVLYAPKTPSVSVRPPGGIKEGGSVTLSCSSDANPAADYTWFKDNQPLLWEPSQPYTLDPVSSKDRGTYHCQAENQYGYLGSNSVFIDVLYAPKTPSVSVRPPGGIKEGGSVTLSCSSDANPAADYTWFKDNQPLLWEPSQPYTLDPVSSKDRGTYHCQAENQYGYLGSNSVFIDVLYAPKTPSVSVRPPGEIKEGGSVTLSCSSDANPAADYTWFRDNQPLPWEPRRPYTLDPVRSKDRGTYRCHAENQYGYLGSNSVFIDVLYAPKTPSVSVRPPGEIMEGGSVTLSCSSDANPAADYTWFKDNQSLLWEPRRHYTLDPVRSKDRGTYRCHAENQYGYLGSNSVFIDVQYAPKTPSVSVRPPGGIKEGGSVTLSCSSDANPAADYTWFKDNQPLLWEPSQPYTLDPVSSKDRGTYHCQAENQYGYLGSNSVFIDVLYAPKTPSVSVRPPGGIKEGGSVTLSCSSDANPAADYTWFREHGGSVGELGENYTISNITTELGGNYYCEARNAVGLQNSTLMFLNVTATPSSSSSGTTTVAAGTVAVLLASILLIIFLWMRRKRASRKARGQGGRPDTRQESPPCPVYDNVSALTNRSASAAQREPIEEQDDPHYASIHISRSKNQEVAGGFAGSLVESDHTEQVLYSAINLKRPKAVPDDSKLMSELYTTIKYMSQKMHYF
ncbi:hemicentin-2 isoform X4 [Gadus morhua]|uniref:hemicentin-2 isoform X4 n=2 Tax=Gadus morhua TaxID=8049 RepID=UPI0011B75D48|nr:hemicentin-2-like isoform X4 [Gadus morhua]